MTEDPLEQARRHCTRKQLEALTLIAAGYGPSRTARILGISRQAVNDRLEGARLRLQAARRKEAA